MSLRAGLRQKRSCPSRGSPCRSAFAARLWRQREDVQIRCLV